MKDETDSSVGIIMYGTGAFVACALLAAFVGTYFLFAAAILLPAMLLAAAFERGAPSP